MSLRPAPQLHRHDDGEGRVVRRHGDRLLRTGPGHLQEPGEPASPAHGPVQLQMAQRYTFDSTSTSYSSRDSDLASVFPFLPRCVLQSPILCPCTRSAASPTSSSERPRLKTTAGRWCSLAWPGFAGTTWEDGSCWRTPGPPS